MQWTIKRDQYDPHAWRITDTKVKNEIVVGLIREISEQHFTVELFMNTQFDYLARTIDEAQGYVRGIERMKAAAERRAAA